MSHAESEPSDVLTTLIGVSTSLTFDGQGCLLRYSDAVSVPPLLRALGERRVPVSALQRIDLTPPSSAGLGVLRLVLHPGVDPVLAVVGDKPHDSLDPYRIRFYQSQHESALRLRSALEQTIVAAPTRTSGFLLAAPPPPRTIRGMDAIAEFDGRVIRLSWRSLADEAKTSGGPTRVIPLSIIEGIEWSAPSTTGGGHLRITVAGCDEMIPDIGKDPSVVLLYPGTTADSILFVAVVRVALAAPRPIIVRRNTESGGDRNFTGVAERNGEQVGVIHAHTPDGSPHLREIGLLVTSAGGQDPNATDALLADVLHWASMSGATAVTRWVTDWPEHREEYECQGFGLVGKWRPAGTDDCRVEEWQIRATLRPDPQLWQGELLSALGNVGPRKPGWWYVLRWAGIGLIPLSGASIATVRIGSKLPFDQWLRLGNFSLASVLVAVMITAFAWPLLRAASRTAQMSRVKTAAAMLRKDPRLPVLYLRSFQDDKSTRKATRIGSLTTEEQAVATQFEAHPRCDRGSYSAGVRAGGSQGPVVKSWRRAWSLSMPHLVAVSR